jgi:hypothetical protein
MPSLWGVYRRRGMTIQYMENKIEELEKRICQLEQKIKHMAEVGDTVEVECHLYGDVYEIRHVEINDIMKGEEE